MAEELLKGSLADTEVGEIRVKEDNPYIKPVKKFWAKGPFYLVMDIFLHLVIIYHAKLLFKTDLMALGYEPCSKIGGHDDYGGGEVHRSAHSVCKPSIVKDL